MIPSKRTILLGDTGHVGAGVEYPNVFGRVSLLEEDDVRLDALAIRRECAARQAQHGMQVAILHQDFKHLAGFAGGIVFGRAPRLACQHLFAMSAGHDAKWDAELTQQQVALGRTRSENEAEVGEVRQAPRA